MAKEIDVPIRESRFRFYPLFLVVLGSGPSSESALECPSDRDAIGGLKETSKTIAEQADTFAAQGKSAIPSIIYMLRHRVPQSTNAEIANNLIKGYFPALNGKTELSDEQRKAQIERLAYPTSKRSHLLWGSRNGRVPHSVG
jgi:hypothetical protein